MASVTLGSTAIISNDEGGWVYTPGQKGNAREIRRLVRARRARVAEMADNPAVHVLVLTVVGNTAAIASYRQRLESLARRGPGTLSVPGYPSVPYCVFVGDPKWGEQKAVEDGWMYEITVEIVEL